MKSDISSPDHFTTLNMSKIKTLLLNIPKVQK